MFSFKKFFATAALAFAATTTPAMAQPGGVELYTALDNAGVEITTGNCEAKGVTGTYGFFMPSKNWIHICEDVAVSDAQQWETLRHEAVHAAQQCMNPNMTSTLTTPAFLQKYGNQSEWEFIKSAYEKHDWLIELEAFTLMKLSNSQVADIVAEACL